MKNKEAWVRKTLESIDDIQHVDLSSHLADRIIRSSTVKENIRLIRPITKWAVAASIVLLAGLNVFSIIRCKSPAHPQNETNPVYKEYFSYINNF